MLSYPVQLYIEKKIFLDSLFKNVEVMPFIAGFYGTLGIFYSRGIK